jgi:hypothetical protein
MRANWIGGLVVLMVMSVGSVWGEDTSWTNVGGGDWFDQANWTSGVPLSNDRVYIDNGGTVRIDGGETEQPYRVWIGYDNSGGMELISGIHKTDYIYLGENIGALGEYAMSGGNLEASYMVVGRSGQGVFSQTGGTAGYDDGLTLGSQSGSTGVYTIGGLASLETDEFFIGNRGAGNFVHNGGTVAVNNEFTLGESSSGEGTYTLSDGSLTSGDLTYIGYRGTGQFLQEGGAASLGSLTIGWSETGSGTYTLNDGQLTSNNLIVGQYGMGSFTQTGGTCSTGHLVVRTGNSYVLSGGSLTFSDSAEIAGTFDLGGGSPSISVGGIGDFVNMTNPGAPTLTVGAESLAYFASNVDPYAAFASITNNGIIHQRGSALTIGPSTVIRGQGNIYDHVYVQGKLSTPGLDTDARINVLDGIFVSDGGAVELGRGSAIIENEISGMSGGQLLLSSVYVGQDGTGRFVHSGGDLDCGGWLQVGLNEGSSGYYELTGNGTIKTSSVRIGESGTGRFIHNGGTMRGVGSSSTLYLGEAGGDGYYEFNSGDVTFTKIYVDNGEFRQDGGYCKTGSYYNDGVFVGSSDGMVGTYRLMYGEVYAKMVTIGYGGEGHFVHSGGTVRADRSLGIAATSSGTGTYELSGDGTVLANRMSIGGEFLQSGGSVDVNDNIQLASGQQSGPGALYRISAGSLNVPEMFIGYDSGLTGTFDIAGASGYITISERFTVNPTGIIRAAPGATIHMTGSVFENESTDGEALSGLENICFIFEGGPARFDTFEIAGKDMGDDPEGFEGNFALGTLQLGGSNVALLQLVDLFDNQGDGQDVPEALYLRNLTIGPGCLLDLNGINLFYVDGDIHPLGQFIGGVPTQIVPEPTTIGMLALGGLAVVKSRKKSARRTFKAISSANS